MKHFNVVTFPHTYNIVEVHIPQTQVNHAMSESRSSLCHRRHSNKPVANPRHYWHFLNEGKVHTIHFNISTTNQQTMETTFNHGTQPTFWSTLTSCPPTTTRLLRLIYGYWWRQQPDSWTSKHILLYSLLIKRLENFRYIVSTVTTTNGISRWTITKSNQKVC